MCIKVCISFNDDEACMMIGDYITAKINNKSCLPMWRFKLPVIVILAFLEPTINFIVGKYWHTCVIAGEYIFFVVYKQFHDLGAMTIRSGSAARTIQRHDRANILCIL